MYSISLGKGNINGSPNFLLEFRNTYISCGWSAEVLKAGICNKTRWTRSFICDTGQHSSLRNRDTRSWLQTGDNAESQQYDPSLTKTDLGTATAQSPR